MWRRWSTFFAVCVVGKELCGYFCWVCGGEGVVGGLSYKGFKEVGSSIFRAALRDWEPVYLIGGIEASVARSYSSYFR
ncbi:hypothetical protein QJS04_geneDACA012717 [Acorus gramineus]|uniref:Uncharacterized protein n=1 Tax=Acorus gramineus TaxID=55184 RepID=A0AAV9A084_ACOGR|nr:hypothetical protein QJS04_geneDACA012717 [Acorus gramineus]